MQTLADWTRARIARLEEEGASEEMRAGYADYAAGLEPDYMSVAGEPLAADHYHEGYGLAAYELGPVTINGNEVEEVAA